MSHKTQNQANQAAADTFSPWTEAFQTNPLHREGSYDRPRFTTNDAQAPTQQALSAIYDPSERH